MELLKIINNTFLRMCSFLFKLLLFIPCIKIQSYPGKNQYFGVLQIFTPQKDTREALIWSWMKTWMRQAKLTKKKNLQKLLRTITWETASIQRRGRGFLVMPTGSNLHTRSQSAFSLPPSMEQLTDHIQTQHVLYFLIKFVIQWTHKTKLRWENSSIN